jgi:hypothetical protein
MLELKGGREARMPFIATNATNPREIELDLDHLSEPWQDIVCFVEAAAGRDIPVVRNGPFRLTSRPSPGRLQQG